MWKWLFAAFVACSSTTAHADFNRWAAEVENDPFTGGQKVAVDYSSSLRSGVAVLCDTSQSGVTIRAVPGFAFTEDMQSLEPLLEFAIDGTRLLSAKGSTGAVGDNIAASQVTLTGEEAKQFINAFANARKQIAIKDGISDRPHLLRASGSTKAGEALKACLAKQ
jgi:hypothetical protein